MTETSSPTPAQPAPRRADPVILWVSMILCWVALSAWGAYLFFHASRAPARPDIPPIPAGTYHDVKAVVPPLSIRLEDDRLVRPAGVADAPDAAAADRVAARLRELLPAGAPVYVEIEPDIETRPVPRAAVWLPPRGAARGGPFPYDAAQLLGAVLVQEGLLKVDTATPYLYLNEFLLIEDDARRHARGLWATK